MHPYNTNYVTKYEHVMYITTNKANKNSHLYGVLMNIVLWIFELFVHIT